MKTMAEAMDGILRELRDTGSVRDSAALGLLDQGQAQQHRIQAGRVVEEMRGPAPGAAEGQKRRGDQGGKMSNVEERLQTLEWRSESLDTWLTTLEGRVDLHSRCIDALEAVSGNGFTTGQECGEPTSGRLADRELHERLGQLEALASCVAAYPKWCGTRDHIGYLVDRARALTEGEA